MCLNPFGESIYDKGESVSAREPIVEFSDDGSALHVRIEFHPFEPSEVVEMDRADMEDEREFKRRYGLSWNPCAREGARQLRLAAKLSDETIKLLASTGALMPRPDGVLLHGSKVISAAGAIVGGSYFFGGGICVVAAILFSRALNAPTLGLLCGAVLFIVAGFFTFRLLYQPLHIVKNARDAVALYMERKAKQASTISELEAPENVRPTAPQPNGLAGPDASGLSSVGLKVEVRDKDTLLKQVAVLALVISKQGGGKYRKSDGGPNVSQICELAQTLVDELSDVKKRGTGKSSLSKSIPEGLQLIQASLTENIPEGLRLLHR